MAKALRVQERASSDTSTFNWHRHEAGKGAGKPRDGIGRDTRRSACAGLIYRKVYIVRSGADIDLNTIEPGMDASSSAATQSRIKGRSSARQRASGCTRDALG
ncbi:MULTISPECIES: hypothetical protein [unclassified Mesorhizobium]|uniref:hypothetical protein n=1 Tax=unclassified Mesorhizobium TaxID=325217 RepID=UPI003336C247